MPNFDHTGQKAPTQNIECTICYLLFFERMNNTLYQSYSSENFNHNHKICMTFFSITNL